jgi:hypothetical protein
MADNSTLPATGDAVRTVDKGGVKTQVVTLDLGGSGAESLVSGAVPVTGSFWQATQPVSGTFWQATQPVSIAGTVAVSGTFWQATQPVSIASMPSTPVTGTFWQATQPVSLASAVAVTDNSGSLTVDSAQLPAALAAGGGLKVEGVAGGVAVPVSGTFWQATQPVSGTVAVSNSSFPVTDNAGSLTVDAPVGTPVFVRLSDGSAAIATLPVSLASLPALATGGNVIGAVTQSGTWNVTDALLNTHAQTFKPVTPQTTLSSANSTVTLTIAAAGASLFHYITRIRISLHNTSAAAVAGSAVTLSFTSTNIPGSLAWTEGNALAAGASKVVCDEVLSQPIKTSVANTATTIVAPACGAGVLCRITVYYYTGA